MNEDYIEYDEACDLKQLGFNEPCIKQWTYMPDLIACVNGYGNPVEKTNEETWYDSGGDCISAPTYSQCFRWFRKNYNLAHSVLSCYGWNGKIINIKNEISIWYNDNYSTYKQAERDCLKELIKIIKSKQ